MEEKEKLNQHYIEVAERLYGSELFDHYPIDNFHTILRVPGGWVINGSAFVPYDNEFQTKYIKDK